MDGSGIKLWVDDERVPRDGWTWIKTPSEAIALLADGDVIELSLDHDLGLSEVDGREPTGYDVLLWIEEQVATSDFDPPRMFVHSANSGARRKMMQAMRRDRETSLQIADGDKSRLCQCSGMSHQG